MATGNFHNVNASKIFAAEIQEDFEYEDLKDNVKSELGLTDYRAKDESELRSYPSSVLGSLREQKHYNNFTVTVQVDVIARSGYYSGCNLDWQLTYDVDGWDVDSTEDFPYYIERATGFSVKNAERHALWAERWAKKKADEMTSLVEEKFGQLTEPLVVVARFSNGETIYQSADSERGRLLAAVNG
jgi:hypothetical protein